ncbi:hypothetical protein Glo7428_3161 [Gloeocapsa sp. PCC 7428]|uniref:hypothetical protein n=1 Tax=Gloeocapsa sp. PCC 7428 TaxID=1173026 RepID=UPI0002A5E178|nr:hypothetical protein [Gloeocapsa sp. PCC 7428]AFZ31648.1 hypothetical protein Glo7428_3161 [Gloeocapsa sp. PCC 7428]
MNKLKASYTTIWIAIAFAIACKELARYTGVAATDWATELRRRAYEKLNKLSDKKLVEYISENFDYD